MELIHICSMFYIAQGIHIHLFEQVCIKEGIFDDWLKDGINVYKAKTLDEFEDKIEKIINKELPSLGDEAYKVAIDRDIKKIGEQLKEVYEEVLKK